MKAMITVVLMSLSSIVVVVFALRTVVTHRRYSYVPPSTTVDLKELPSVSVCISARNETHALAQSLERVLKSDYKKLEILVLDDSSVDDTSLIIKSFANAGVRFIAGGALPSGWLGKNHAYQTLLREASADYVLFLDVDTTIKIGTIRQLMQYTVSQKLRMVSVLPRREDSYRVSAVFGTMRYFWELILSRRADPPASSALWLVHRTNMLESPYELAAYPASVRPEHHLAKLFHRDKDYGYIAGSSELGVGFEKRLRSQYDTAVRLYFPLSGKSVAVMVLYLSCLIGLLIPFAALLAWPYQLESSIVWWSAVLYGLTLSTYWYSVRQTYGRISRQFRIILWPLLILQESALLITSAVAYARGTVSWKGRALNAGPDNTNALRIDD